MKRKRWISLGLAVLMVVPMFSGCGKKEESQQQETTVQETAEQASQKEGKVQLEFWDMTWGPAEYISTAEALVQEFNESQDEIEVTYQSIPWDNFYQTFTTAIVSGSAPDISTGSGYQQHQFAVMGEILSLDPLIEEWKEEGALDDFIDGAIEQFQWEGEQIGIPFNCDPRAIFYRKDIFQEKGVEIPTTWEELADAAVKLSSDDMAGFTCAGSDSAGYWSMANFIYGEGGHIFNENMEPDFNCEQNIQAIRDIQSMEAAGAFPAGTASYTTEESQKLFFQGKAAMTYGAAEIGSNIQNQGSEELVENVDIMPLIPAADGKLYSPGGMNAMMAYKQSQHPEECMTFIKWWSENGERLWSEGHMGSFSVRNSILASDYFQKDKYKKMLTDEVMPYFIATNQPVSHAFPEMAAIEGELLLRDAFQMALDLNNQPEEIADTINDRIAEIMESSEE